MVGEEANSATCVLRAGLSLGAAFVFIVGTLDALARLPVTTRAAAETCGPPDAGWLAAEDAPDVALRVRLEEAAATDAAV